jgi:hypothetical protein
LVSLRHGRKVGVRCFGHVTVVFPLRDRIVALRESPWYLGAVVPLDG